MVHSVVERELKFDVPPGFVIPDVEQLVPAGGRVEHGSEQLRSDYFDTADHALLRAQITLRRRTGTTDNGWQLKVPQPPFREEIRAPLDDTGDGFPPSVPAELATLLLGTVRNQPLIQTASIRTDRGVTRLVDGDGRLLAEIADDRVHASASGDAATASSWREVEIELGGADVDLLYALGKRLRKAGAQPSSSRSKLARALSQTPSATHRGKRTAGDVVESYIAEQRRVILAGDLALRRGNDSVIHKTRVATRRLRSTLRTFRPYFDPARAQALDAELRRYAALLGDVRDRQVLQRRLDAMVADLDATLLFGPVKARIDTELQAERTEHWHRLQDELAGPRYLQLLADIADWVERPPHAAPADRAASSVAKRVARSRRQVRRRLQHANATGDLHLLHAARKAAKRARYAAEAAEPVIGRKASTRQAKRYQRLQDLLGEHQDSIVSADFLRRLGSKAGTTNGENGFSFGILHEREQRNARAARDQAQRAAKNYT
jgi:CHAD domain-containing protein